MTGDERKEAENDVLYVCLFNSIAVVAFSMLAYVFDKWWIALFSLLFIKTYHYTVKGSEEDETDRR